MIIKSIHDILDYNKSKEEIKTIRVPGMAMSPEIKSGDMVVLKRINNFNMIRNGEIYLVETNFEYNNFKLIRKVLLHPKKDKLILHATNPIFSGDLTISKQSIISLYEVMGIYRERWM